MSIHLVPIPLDSLDGTSGTWMPFLEAIAARSRCHVDQLVAMAASGEVHLLVAWDSEAKEAKALGGTRVHLRGDDRVGEVIWLTGSDRHLWQDMFTEMETYHREHLGCVGLRAIARPGWSPFLKQRGYRATHITFEKDFA